MGKFPLYVTKFYEAKRMVGATFNMTPECPKRVFQYDKTKPTVTMKFSEGWQVNHPKVRAKLFYKYIQRRKRIHMTLILFQRFPQLATRERMAKLYELTKKI